MPDQQQSIPSVTVVPQPDGTAYVIPRFRWDANREQAAADLADGLYSKTEIARRASTTPYSLAEWRRNPEFIARVEEYRKTFAQLVMGYGLAQKATRMAHLQERHDDVRTTVAERGRYYQRMAEKAAAQLGVPVEEVAIPGAGTGYVYEKPTRYGPQYMIDTATIATLADIEKQAAIEVGEWNEGNSPAVAVQIVCPASAPAASAAPTVTIGTVR